MHTVLPSPSAQSSVPYLRKEVEVHDSGSRHHPRGKKGALPKPSDPNKTRGPEKRRQMAAAPGFKSQRQSSSAAPFPRLPQLATAASILGRYGPVV